MKITILLLLSFSLQAQSIHVHQMGPNFDPKKVKLLKDRPYKVHPLNKKSLAQQEIDFQNHVFSKAKLKKKAKALSFFQKEEIFDLIEQKRAGDISKKFPQFSKGEIRRLVAAFYG